MTLCDTPGFMVGPEVEVTGQVAHISRLFLAGAHFGQPLVTVILRKGYGLGAMAMAGGGKTNGCFQSISCRLGKFWTRRPCGKRIAGPF